ncbi:MAG: alpha/beta hydrolase [Polyangiales bacterium]
MQRHSFESEGLTLSYLDAGGDAPVLLALHAHWMEAQTYAPLAQALAPDWRVVALDQRGHGDSEHTQAHARVHYERDVLALMARLEVQSAVLLGNSFGATVAYWLASTQPSRVRGMIIEDMGVVYHGDGEPWVLEWQGTFKTRADLEARIGARYVPYLRDSFRERGHGWRLAFDPREHMKSSLACNGDHWHDWLASTCPALVLKGADSKLTTEEELRAMASKRPNTRYESLPGGHVPHMDCPVDFTRAVQAFLRTLK